MGKIAFLDSSQSKSGVDKLIRYTTVLYFLYVIQSMSKLIRIPSEQHTAVVTKNILEYVLIMI